MAIYKTNVSDKLEGALNQKENIWEDIRTLARHKNIGKTSTGTTNDFTSPIHTK